MTNFIGFILAIVLFLFLFVGVTMNGYKSGIIFMQKEAVKNHTAHYDPETREFMWNTNLVVTTNNGVTSWKYQ